MLSLHARTALLALIPLLIWGSYRIGALRRTEGPRQMVEIGVEHSGPASLALTHSSGGTLALVDVANESDHTLGVSLPAHWERGEVKNVPLAQVTAGEENFGFRRWSIPAGGIITFDGKLQWSRLMLHNPSGTPLRVKITTVDIVHQKTSTDAYLVTGDGLDLSF